MKLILTGLMITVSIAFQNHQVMGDEPSLDKAESRYQLPAAEYDDSFGVTESRRSLMTGRQMAISRAVKKAKQRRNRIAIQKLTGRSISRPGAGISQSTVHSYHQGFYSPYWGYHRNHQSQIRFRTSFE